MNSMRIIGPGRAGRSLALAMTEVGWDVADIVGRGGPLASAAQGVDVLVVATGDDAVATVAGSVDQVDTTLVVHLSGSLGLDVLAPHKRRASMHPLMTLPDPYTGKGRLLSGIAFAADGDPAVAQVIAALGGETLNVDPADRALYHATAAIASNHLVALAGQVERLAASIGVPLHAYLALMAASLENVELAGSAARALTGPAARGDLNTIARHLAALPAGEVDTYKAMAREAMRLAGRDPNLLEDTQ
ncbi:MAG: DUF2520 domain-containing protein [Acidimicrobiales bacterium]